MDDWARLVLRVLVDNAANLDLPLIEVDASICPNCGAPNMSTRTPYCSDRCKALAAFVRQLRTALDHDGPSDDRMMMFGQTLWFLMGGGRPLRVSIAPASAIKQVFKRTDGKCETCGAPATTIDNVGSG